jgi:hypothetical protein
MSGGQRNLYSPKITVTYSRVGRVTAPGASDDAVEILAYSVNQARVSSTDVTVWGTVIPLADVARMEISHTADGAGELCVWKRDGERLRGVPFNKKQRQAAEDLVERFEAYRSRGLPEHESGTTAPTHWAEDLERLAELRDRGIVTDEEFNAKKRQLLGLNGEQGV